MRTLYHATPETNAGSIMATGLRPSADGFVYLTESIEDAQKFLFYEQSNVWVFSVKVSKQDEQYIEETFDHSARFYACRVFGYRGTVPASKIKPVAILSNNKNPHTKKEAGRG